MTVLLPQGDTGTDAQLVLSKCSHRKGALWSRGTVACSGPQVTELGRSVCPGRPGFGTLCGHGLRGWGDACLGFCPRSVVSWTV